MRPAWQFVLVIAALLLINVVPAYIWGIDGAYAWRLLSWAGTILLFLVALIIVGRRMTNDWRGVLVDKRNVMSLSRLQLVIWTTIIISGMLTAAIANVVTPLIDPNTHAVTHIPDPLVLGIQPEIWGLRGISGTSFVATPIILDRDPASVSTNTGNTWEWADIFLGDKTTNDGRVDLSKVQQFFFTVIVVAVFMMKLGYTFATTDKVMFPAIDTGFVALLGISHAAYLIHKAS